MTNFKLFLKTLKWELFYKRLYAHKYGKDGLDQMIKIIKGEITDKRYIVIPYALHQDHVKDPVKKTYDVMLAYGADIINP